MRKLLPLLLWWLTLSITWGIFRLFESTEIVSELIAKPLIWLGITGLFLNINVIPQKVVSDLKSKYLTQKPFLQIFLLPIIGITIYFFLMNFTQIKTLSFNPSFLLIGIIVNFSTGAIEELVYRGFMYVWLLDKTNEVTAFILIQILFTLGHIPILILTADSLNNALTRVFFILLLGSIHTGIFRINKSLYSSSLSHGVWNTLVYYFLLN